MQIMSWSQKHEAQERGMVPKIHHRVRGCFRILTLDISFDPPIPFQISGFHLKVHEVTESKDEGGHSASPISIRCRYARAQLRH